MEKQILRSREISMLHCIDNVLGLCFLTSKKEET